jgi:putative coproporphyrinogen dehydrogenase
MRKQLELYVHIPFCEKKCLYCDFLSFSAEEDLHKAYVDKLIEEIRVQASNYSQYQISSIFIGGGTPTVIKAVYISNIMSAIYEAFIVESQAEITIECNPGTVDIDKLLVYKQSGINRISVGLQSTVDKELQHLGRIHTYADFLNSYEKIRESGYKNVNIDLMSALPWQTLDSWKSTLKKVIMLKPEHISAYSLIIEEGTEFSKIYGSPEGRKFLPTEEVERAMYHSTIDILKNYGYERYEISNYAKPGYESKHNIGYWTGEEYLGFGIGASSYVYGRRFHVERDIKKYLAIDMKRDIMPLYQNIHELSTKEKMEEFMFLGLRLSKGVLVTDFYDRFGIELIDVFEKVIQKNISFGLLKYENLYLKLTDKGLDLSNRVMGDFLL